MESKKLHYKSAEITVSYDPKICIHAAECVKGLPNVFDPDKKPWVNPADASADEIAEVIHRCPTGALKYERQDGGEPEPVPEGNKFKVAPNGPIYFTGSVSLYDTEGNLISDETRIALCRCGHSKHKPFCDNTHLEVKFNAE